MRRRLALPTAQTRYLLDACMGKIGTSTYAYVPTCGSLSLKALKAKEDATTNKNSEYVPTYYWTCLFMYCTVYRYKVEGTVQCTVRVKKCAPCYHIY